MRNVQLQWTDPAHLMKEKRNAYTILFLKNQGKIRSMETKEYAYASVDKVFIYYRNNIYLK
jgi:hypothetical protein